MQTQDYIGQVQQLIHDSSSLDFSQTELITFINNARVKAALDFACVRTYFLGGNTIVGQEIYPINGGVAGALVTNGGAYSTAPTVTFGSPPAGGQTATGFCVMAGIPPTMQVVQIAMTNWGFGYTATPTVTFSSGAATATATALVNVIDFHAISYLNGAQRTMLQWKPFAYFNAVFRSNILSAGAPAVWSNYTEQNSFFLFPANPDQNYPLEIDAYVLPNPLVNPTDVDIQINAPMSDSVQYYAAHLALLKAQNFQQAGYYEQKYEQRRERISVTRNAVRRLNIYQNVYRRMQRGY